MEKSNIRCEIYESINSKRINEVFCDLFLMDMQWKKGVENGDQK